MLVLLTQCTTFLAPKTGEGGGRLGSKLQFTRIVEYVVCSIVIFS